MVIGGLESNAGFLFVEPFECCIIVIDNRDDQLAAMGNAASATNHVIAFVNVLIDHALAADLKGEDVVAVSKTGLQR